MGRNARKATLLVQVGTASPACGSAMVKKTAKMEQMNFSVVNKLILSCMEELPRNKLKCFVLLQVEMDEIFGLVARIFISL